MAEVTALLLLTLLFSVIVYVAIDITVFCIVYMVTNVAVIIFFLSSQLYYFGHLSFNSMNWSSRYHNYAIF